MTTSQRKLKPTSNKTIFRSADVSRTKICGLVFFLFTSCAIAQIDTLQATPQAQSDTASMPAWHGIPHHCKVMTLQVETDEGQFKGILLVGTPSLLILWNNMRLQPNLNARGGNVKVFGPDSILRFKSLLRTYMDTLPLVLFPADFEAQ
jgi:hypothetical protein